MVLQVSVQENQGFDAASNKIDGLFTVTVDGKRIKPHNPTDHCFELLTLCVGSHCLIMQLHGGKYNPSRHRGDRPFEESPKAVKEFFENPRVFVVATDMSKTSERLRARHDISICNLLDLNELGMKRNRTLAAASFDQLVITVMGKSHDVIRPPKVDWWPRVRK